MTDRLDEVLGRARASALAEVRPPGADQVRRTVRRRRGVAAVAGVTAAVVLLAGGIALARGPQEPPPATPAPSDSEFFPPEPTIDPTTQARYDRASDALGDRRLEPNSDSTAGVVSGSFGSGTARLAPGEYRLYVFCFGEGSLDIRVTHAGKKLAAGTVPCAEEGGSLQLAVHQESDQGPDLELSGDERADGKAAFSYKFVNERDIKASAGAETKANAEAAAAALGVTGKVTTEDDKTVDKAVGEAGDYAVRMVCAGPGRLSFIVRSGATLRDGTVATNGRTESAQTVACSDSRPVTVDVALGGKSGISITAEADDAARNRAGWSYSIDRK
ncbi:hypothetical protein [Symbioplanes lichenis]|uniref:hypothetical protein n=1 Tax=Symbioplanes lichenis TaxID=1629072 RepID=UPI0027385322|nr:hypothetical protein [Actinoplanes lichenis]